ncbi:solute carrier family 2 member 9, like 1 isoform X2 [Syngnathus scovelli]|uniref:solute carrier family 2 member 9, like 1 isoform X2 n=1 Tax=Syngnathus scovelli TaxID=161590 RepID=UPI00210FE4D1|nr:solute carrier family 2 member 9, like 1 isoform X2 [Syngnathus scovelli]
METVLQQLTRGNALFLILILGIGGSFQAGYHMTSISSPSPFIKHFINSTWYERYAVPPPGSTITIIWSLIVSMFAVGGLLGAISVKSFSGLLGRKKAVICNSFIAIAAATIMLTSKWAKSYEMIIVARILFGYSAALGMSTHLMYLSEMSPRKLRGAVTMTSATFASFGKLSAQFMGLSEILGRQELWNVVLCVPACLSVVHVMVMPYLPEAPRYLFIEKRDDKGCQKALQSLWGQGNFKQEMEEMLTEQATMEAAPTKSPLLLLQDQTVRWQLITMSTIYCCNQLSGMSVVSTFAFDIFRRAGIPTDQIRYITVGLGVTEMITSISCGSNAWAPYLTAVLIILFIIFFSGGPGAAAGTLNSEIFIQSNRVSSFVLFGIQRWSVFAVMGLAFPILIDALDTYCFVIFACMSLLGCIYIFFLLPETKGKTLLEISDQFKAITVCGKSFQEESQMETKL